MLHGLGRWLRAAGHDTAIAEAGADDRDVLARARREGRVLVTCDRHLAGMASVAVPTVLLRPAGLDAQADTLRAALGLDWLAAPFTRCMMDNAVLLPAGPDHWACLPPTARREREEVRICPACGRLYWPGSHVRRMRARLAAWRQGPSADRQDAGRA